MSDLIQNINQKAQNITSLAIKEGKGLVKYLFNGSAKIGKKGKIYLEVEKLKWELRQKHLKLGRYVSENKLNKSVTDFSHDKIFFDMVGEINKLKLYIKERNKKIDLISNKTMIKIDK